MAGSSLSHILDPPRPNSRRETYPASSSYSHRDSPRSSSVPQPYQQQQQQQQAASGGAGSFGTAGVNPAAVSPNTRNLTTTPPILPPPGTSASSTLQVRPAPGSASARASGSIAAGINPSTSTPALGAASPPTSITSRGHGRGDSLSQGHVQGHVQLEPGAASSASPSSPGLTPAASNTGTPNSQSNHRGNNLYACRDCGRSYSRPEHLVRHVQTHTLGRRFVCEICQKSFARKDLLRRHVANHDNDSPKKRRRTTTSPGAGRVSHACRSCAIARVKCDDAKPCKRCISRKLTCVSTEAPSTAAMHLMHFSANAHSSASGTGDAVNTSTNEAVSDRESSKPVTAHSSVASRDSHSPGSFAQQQPRSLPAPQSLHEPAAPHQQSQYYQRASLPSNIPSAISKTSSYEPRTTTYPPPQIELEPATSAMDPARLPFSDFLRDVLNETSDDSAHSRPIQGLTILDFCDQTNLDLVDDDFELLDHWNIDGNHALAHGSRSLPGAHVRDNSADIAQVRQDLVNIWTNSSWSPDPRGHEGGVRDQRATGTTTGGSDSSPEPRDRIERVTMERLEHSARDRVLGIIFARQAANTRRVASSFPSVDVMDMLLQNFLVSLAQQASEWLHFPTFRINAQAPEWLAVAAASGAALSPIPTLRRFGFVLQDAARASLPTQFEDASTIRDIALVQALLLTQEIGLWSGNRRRMEIAQSHLAIPVTLMRYRNKFQRSSYPVVAVEPSDEGADLEEKWLRWVDRERWKRLVYHSFLRDAQCSMTTLTNQAMSYAELTLPLPEPRELWLARSPSEWKAEYLHRHAGPARHAPSIGDLFHDIHSLPSSSQLVDIQLSVSVYLHGFWALILEYRKLSAVHRTRSYTNSMGGNQNLLLSSRHQELVKELQSFQLNAQEWPDMTAQEHLLLNLLIMNLHVSLDDLQLFAGKEGEEQARRIYPVLQQWALSSEARSSVWCAAQVLRYAKAYPPGQLKDFHAVAVHHAALALWTYSVVTQANRRPQPLPSQYQSDLVHLDGPETGPTQRFIGIGQGRPAIRGPMVQDAVAESSLEDPRACMAIVQDILRFNFKEGAESVPPMVDNLCILAAQLGDAAWAADLVSS